MDDSLPAAPLDWQAYAVIAGIALQAISVLAIGGVGAWIAHQQMRIADSKLQHDLFDRRHAIFHAARTLIWRIQATAGRIDLADLQRFNSKTLDAEFLLSVEVSEYIAQLARRAALVAGKAEEAAHTATPAAEGVAANKAKWEEIKWFNDQPDVLKNKFAPFLQFKR